jgi:hypothetical protein
MAWSLKFLIYHGRLIKGPLCYKCGNKIPDKTWAAYSGDHSARSRTKWGCLTCFTDGKGEPIFTEPGPLETQLELVNGPRRLEL